MVFNKITSKFEILFIDDNSTDGSWIKLKELHKLDNRIKIIHLLKNYGQHNAILCGFHNSNGRYIITLDDDLQNPPEEIPKLIDKISEGFKCVFGNYIEKKHDRMENFLSTLAQNLIRYILKIPNNLHITNFAIFDRDIVNNIKTIKTSYVFLPALISKSTPINKITNIDVIHQARRVGSSNYNFLKYLKLILNLIINYSALPLIIVSSFGLILSIMSVGFGISIIIEKLINPSYGVMGWNSLMVSIAFLGGVILFTLGIIGEYLRRILGEVSYEQPFAIGEMHL